MAMIGPDVATIRDMHGQGASAHTIAAALNADGLRTVLGRRWSPKSVRQVVDRLSERAEREPMPATPEHAGPVEVLRAAIAAGEMVLHYQPKVDLRRGRCVGVEALIRWQHPVRGLVYPDAFVPLAEAEGLADELTRWVVADAIAQAALWADTGQRMPVAVNVPPSCLLGDWLVDWIFEQLQLRGVSPYSLEIELTESGIVADPGAVIRSLSRLKLRGIHCALDDFGTGFSSLTHLVDLPIRTLKIDKSFVLAMGADDRSDAIVTGALALGDRLGLQVVAEGVEDEQTALALRERGCAVGQGYFWSRPVPADEVTSTCATIDAAATHAAPGVLRTGLMADALVLTAAHRAMSRILRAETDEDIQDAVAEAVAGVGGVITSADGVDVPGMTVLDVDCSLGLTTSARLPAARTGSLAAGRVRQLLEILLPDAHLALALRLAAHVEAPLPADGPEVDAPSAPGERPGAFVVQSAITVPAQGAPALERAFSGRLRLVEGMPGFQRLEVWRDSLDPAAYVMCTWWRDEQSFREYMSSAEHHSSHARIPSGSDRARPAGLRRFTMVAT
jgi:EAL domain-containing protein (putative c-di-GMP-specific phosphodiesterase class I)/heme-degrading monooxygenase HmoA